MDSPKSYTGETKEDILAAASHRVVDRISQWNPGSIAGQEIKETLLSTLPNIIEDRDGN